MVQMFNAHVEVDRTTEPDPDPVLAALDTFHPAIGTSARGFASAQISLPAENLAQAVAVALTVVSAAYGGAPAIACEVMTEKEFRAREGWEDLPELVSVTEAAGILGVSRQAILQRIESRKLPATKIGREYVIPRDAVR